jgi:nitroimidazol reductase NimA-like FMN-containing flavoprotein (pyridoxamine 5'-phosphate oxidase superfamily)
MAVEGGLAVAEGVSLRGLGGPRAERPGIVEGYGVSSGEEGLLAWDHVRERMASSRNYWIGTTRPDGRPHAAPVWGVWFDDALFFGTDPNSRKARNLRANPEIVVHLESGDDSVILEGVVEGESDPELRRRAGEAYAAKYGFDALGGADEDGPPVYVLRPRVAFAWLESSFPETATRWRF